ncbi:orexin receptor type 2-like isoform X2 [Topomyia yanbarensis]|uniref:orexin receptor type 2-like isoform X2 n=1 Tax=Topomyia yanbarensis TaxID=2498891 RepID=UPI00273B9556|nr:orexin receptor type 2-like isoform X2 [Topomyia yanbarensis]
MISHKPFTVPRFTAIALLTVLGLGNVQISGAGSATSATNHHRTFYPSASSSPTTAVIYSDDSDSMNRALIYPKTTNSLSPPAPNQIGGVVANNISKGSRQWALVKRDTTNQRRLPVLDPGDASSSSVETDAFPIPSVEPAMLNFNGAICRNGSAFHPSVGACISPPNGTKSLGGSGSGENQTATSYYTIVNLDNHNDVLCDKEEYDVEEYNENCFIDHNVTCVGDPLYCNLTYEEYRQLLMDYIYPSTGEWILIASHTVVFIIGLVGNALVCIAVYTNHTMRTVTNIFIVNLAVADFFVILCCLPPTVVWDVTETWFLGQAMCKVIIYFQTVSVTVSVLTLTFISIDRWYAICFPLRYKPRPERAWRSIAVIWLIGFLSDLPEFLVLTTRRKKLRFDIKLFTQCVATWDKEKEKTFYIIKFVFLYLLPLLFMTVAYIQIILILWRSDTIPGHRESRTQPCGIHSTRSTLNCVGNTSTMGQLRARRKAAKMLVAVVVMFAGCYCPVHMLNVARYSFNIGQNDIVAVLSLFSHWLCYANSAANPVIYNFMSGKFRREFKNALEKCHCLRNPRGLGGRVGGYDDRSMYHTATRMNISPSTRSNYQMTSNTQQTSFNGSRHLHNRNSINHAGSLKAQQNSPVSLEERMALTKNVDGCDQSGGAAIPTNNTTTTTASIGGSGGTIGSNNCANYTNNNSTNGSSSNNNNNNNHHHHYHQHHGNGSTSEGATGATTLMIVNKSSNCKINGT